VGQCQRDGRPAEYRWRPLFNAAKFGWRPLLKCRAVTLPSRETRWNLMECPKLANRSQLPVGRSSPYNEGMWGILLFNIFQLSVTALVVKIWPEGLGSAASSPTVRAKPWWHDDLVHFKALESVFFCAVSTKYFAQEHSWAKRALPWTLNTMGQFLNCPGQSCMVGMLSYSISSSRIVGLSETLSLSGSIQNAWSLTDISCYGWLHNFVEYRSLVQYLLGHHSVPTPRC